ncbi:MAG: conjugative transposon protein TraK [Bacteroides sp.]|uniref:conjugative transposon protein TraK n=1 Tax=Bacteroides sp. TaxID=29523 RepID=UPI002FCCA4A7
MDFKSLQNIESSFQRIRLFMLVFCIMCTLLTVFSVWKAFDFAEEQRKKVYVLDQGKSLMLALSQDMSQNRPVEAREHVRRFHELMFTLAPDKAAIESNADRAFQLADRSAYQYYNDLKEKGYYSRLLSSNTSQIIEIDSMQCNFDEHPYSVKTFARQLIVRESNVTERSLVSTCRLRNSVRSDNSPHGFIIEKFKVIENKDIRDYDRTGN